MSRRQRPTPSLPSAPPEAPPFRLALLAVLLFLAGSGMSGGAVSLFRAVPPLPTATPTELPPTPTPQPTSTPIPTATPTATPVPAPALQIEVSPSAPTQGQTVVIHVRTDRATRLDGDIDGRPLTFFYETPTDAWALAGIPANRAAETLVLGVTATAPEGTVSTLSQPLSVQEGSFFAQDIFVPAELSLLLVPEVRSVEERYLSERLQGVTPEILWEGPLGIPSEGLRTSPYGAARSYAGGPVTSYHGGLDYAAPQGTGVFAAASGRVVMAEPLTVRGNTVVLDHGMSLFTIYAHLSQIGVQVGQEVARGEWVGAVGSSGLSTGPHLHWEVRIGDVAVNPDEWLSRSYP